METDVCIANASYADFTSR